MISDSHAHYNNNSYKMTYGENGYALKEGDWTQRLQKLQEVDMP